VSLGLYSFGGQNTKIQMLFSFLLQVQLTEEELQEIISQTKTELR